MAGVALGFVVVASGVMGLLALLSAPRRPPERVAFAEHPTAGATVSGVIPLESRRGLAGVARALVGTSVDGLHGQQGVEVLQARAVRRPGGVSIDVRLECVSRGRHSIGPLTSTMLDPFGFVQVRVPVLGRCEVPVAPAMVEVSRAIVDPDAGEAAPALTGDRRGPVLREYLPGDDMRHVHWPSSARLGQMMVRTPESDSTRTRLVLTLLPGQPGDDLEWAVAMGASIAVAVVEDGGDVRFAVPRGPVLAQVLERGHTGRDAILDCATDADAGTADPLELLGRGHARRDPATVVIPAGAAERQLAFLGGAAHAGDIAVVRDDLSALIPPLVDAGWTVVTGSRGGS